MTAAILPARVEALEAALRAAERRQRLLFLDNPLPMWVYDCETLAFLDVNAAVTSYYGYTPDELLGMTLLDLRALEDATVLRQILPRPEAPSKRMGPWRHVTKDGRIIEVETVSQPTVFRGRGARLVTAIDVTARNEALRTAERNRRHFETLVENSPDLVWRFDRELRCVYVSASVLGLTGRPPAAFIGKPLPVMGLPVLAVRIAEPARVVVLRTGQRQDVDLPFAASDGSTRHLESLLTAELDADGGVASVLMVTRDITRHKHAEDALRDSEARFRSLTELSSDYYWEQDEQYRFTYFSEPAQDATSGAANSAIGKQRWELPCLGVSEEQWAAHRLELEQRRSFRNLELRRIMGDGKEHVISVSGAPMFDGGGRFRGYHGVATDITHRKNAEEALRRSEERFRYLVELSNDWYWEQDADFRFVQIDAAATRKTGGMSSDHLGKTRWEIPGALVSEAEQKRLDDLTARRLPFRDFVIKRELENGEVRTHLVSGIPIFDGAGTFCGYRGVGRDITERERLRQALAESEERIRLATQFGNVGTWERDIATGRLSWSRNIGPMLGLPEGTTLPTLEDFLRVVHPQDLPQLNRARQAWLNGESELEAEHRVIGPDGTVHWVYQRGSVVRAADGLPVRTLGIIQDVTKRKEAELALRESEERFRLVAENMRDVFWVMDCDMTRVEYLGPAFEQTWGIPREAVYRDPRSWVALVAPDDLPALEAARITQRAGDPIEVQFRITRPDGEVRWLSARSSRMTNSRGEHRVCGVTEDITARKRAEAALRRSEEFFRQLAENVSEVFWIGTPDFSRILYVSRAYERLWGRPREEVYRDPMSWRDGIVREDRPQFDACLKRQARGLPTEIEARILRPDGSTRWIWAESSPFVNTSGERLVTGIVHDITDRRREQERKIGEAMRQRDTLVREVHHRIKNNLQGVAGLLRRHAQRRPSMAPALEAAIAQVQSIAIVHGLQGIRYAHSGVALCEIIEAIARMLQTLTQARIQLDGVREANRATRLAEGETVATALVLNELIMNAVKHSAAADQNGAVTIELQRGASGARVTVRNPGSLPDGFDFAAEAGVGTGLGLVRALMPTDGMSIDIRAANGEVEAVLTVGPPITLTCS